MPQIEPAPQTRGNTGYVKVTGFEPPAVREREDFFRDLKKVVRKLPPDHPSRSDSRKR